MSARGNVCRAGHASEEADYCSVCGVAMAPPAGPLALSASSSSPVVVATGACPECSEPRAAGARFCEVCRFEFSGASSTPVIAEVIAAAAASWEIVVESDPALDDEPDEHTPPQRLARTIRFDRAELLVGRRDDQRDIHPDIAVEDPGASRRHVKLVRLAGGGVQLQDLASTNGTQLNGAPLAPGTRVPLQPTDTVTLGRWTRLTLRPVASPS